MIEKISSVMTTLGVFCMVIYVHDNVNVFGLGRIDLREQVPRLLLPIHPQHATVSM